LGNQTVLPKSQHIDAQERISRAIFIKFLPFVGSFITCHVLKFGVFAQMVSELWGFKFRDVRVTVMYSAP